MNNQNSSSTSFDRKVHRYGKISSFAICILFILVPLAIQMAFGVTVDWGGTMVAFTAALVTFGPVAVTEFLSYAPILGAGGQYLAFTTGNIMNMKLPAATNAIKICDVEPGSKEAEAASMVAIGISSIVTTVILFLGLILSAQLLPALQSATLTPAFDNVMPAILGAIAAPILVKNLKLSSVPCILAAILTIAVGYGTVSAYQSYFLPLFLVISLLWAYFLFKRESSKDTATLNSK